MLSLALAIGACTSAFRLIDAILLRPLPVAAPEQLYSVWRVGASPVDGTVYKTSEWAYPSFQLMRAAAKGQAELLAVSFVEPMDVTYKSDAEMEKATCSTSRAGCSIRLDCALPRAVYLTDDDDSKPRAHPYAVISYEYWERRFGRDVHTVGRSFQLGQDFFQIVGVGPKSFTGTQTGTVTDIFLPTMMHPAVTHDDWTWHRTLVRGETGRGDGTAARQVGRHGRWPSSGSARRVSKA